MNMARWKLQQLQRQLKRQYKHQLDIQLVCSPLGTVMLLVQSLEYYFTAVLQTNSLLNPDGSWELMTRSRLGQQHNPDGSEQPANTSWNYSSQTYQQARAALEQFVANQIELN